MQPSESYILVTFLCSVLYSDLHSAIDLLALSIAVHCH